MKTSVLTLTLVAATLILGPAGLPAQTDPTAEIIKRFDRNGDGKLDEAEKIVAKETMAREARPGPGNRMAQNPGAGPGVIQQRLAEFDRNGDGHLDESERAEMEVAMRSRMEQTPGTLRRFDTDGDGKLSDSEWAEARAQFNNRLSQAGGPQAKGPQAKGAQRPGNPEAGASRPGPQGKVGPGAPGRPSGADALRARAEGNPRILNRFDRNGDGKLDDAEWAAAQQELGARRGGPPAPPSARAE